ncbi:MAG: flagellar biosynthetic protein FliR [Nitriliruptoraceae bacterium]|nr:flagellar biosynthetic protein FliR [Nitriliruptoraceae bacterium]
MTPGIVEVPIDPAWAVGLVLAMARIAAFVLASPVTGRFLPATARIAATVALSLAAVRPVPGLIEMGDLIAAAGINVVVGLALGWVSGLILQLFTSAGGIVDLISGLSVATIFDPLMGDQSGVFARMFNLTAMTLFVVTGGLGLLVSGLLASLRLIPLDASLAPQGGLTAVVIETVSEVMRRGVELALPIMGVMLLLELALGLAARFAPQTNVFLLGLPAKTFAAITLVGSAWVLFPDAMASAQDVVVRNLELTMRGLGAEGFTD